MAIKTWATVKSVIILNRYWFEMTLVSEAGSGRTWGACSVFWDIPARISAGASPTGKPPPDPLLPDLQQMTHVDPLPSRPQSAQLLPWVLDGHRGALLSRACPPHPAPSLLLNLCTSVNPHVTWTPCPSNFPSSHPSAWKHDPILPYRKKNHTKTSQSSLESCEPWCPLELQPLSSPFEANFLKELSALIHLPHSLHPLPAHLPPGSWSPFSRLQGHLLTV